MMNILGEATHKLLRIETDLFCIVFQVVLCGFGSLFKQHIVVLPKLTLILRAPRCLGRTPRLRMQGIERQVPKEQPDLARVFLKHLGQRRLDPLAEWAVEVRKLHKRHWSIRCPTNRRPIG